MRHFTPAQLQQYLAEASVPPLLLDVREPWEFDVCRLEQAQLVPMRQIPEACNELGHDREIVIICHHGIRSRQVAIYMEQQGFSDVINLSGGMAGWAQDIDPGMATY